MGALAKALGGFTPSSGAKQMMQEGVQPTVGQGIDKSGIFGRSIGKLEEAAKSIPFIGQAVEHARSRAGDDWATSIVKKAEIPALGVSAKGAAGHEAMGNLQSTYSDAYNSILAGTQVHRDVTFNRMIRAIVAREPDIKKGVDKELSILGNKSMSASDMHAVAGTLRDMGGRYSKSPSAAEHYQGEAYKDVAQVIRDYMASKLSPDKAGALKDIDTGYGLFKTMQKAASSVAANEGKFSGRQLLNAVKSADKTKDKSAFARGAARLQDEAQTAKQVLGDTLSESGTTPRAIVSGTLLGGASVINPATLALIPAAWAGQTRPVQKALLGGYEKQQMIAETIRKLLQPTMAGAVNE
jgi:hypothetical protein